MDARTLNWRFVVPDEPAGLLLVPVAGEHAPSAVVVEPDLAGLGAAMRRGPYPAIAVPDLGALLARRRPGEVGRLVARLCSAVVPGGWLCVGFANAWYPGAPGRSGSLDLGAVRRALRCSAMSEPEVYLALPSQRRPALLVPAAWPEELDHVLRQLFLTYVPPGSSWVALRRQILGLLRRTALVAPHRIRSRLAPAFYVVARRPA
jgi:hypothetical protein